MWRPVAQLDDYGIAQQNASEGAELLADSVLELAELHGSILPHGYDSPFPGRADLRHDDRVDAAPTPPDLEGFEYQSTLGSGGFADVYRYSQRFPRRPVAIKVLRATAVDRAARYQFIAEANTMAQLSSHPAIATVFSAGVTDDDRPYLVMEYCSNGSLGTTYRLNALPLDQILRIGIRIASALEASHRLGIVHRDVKPANILITDYGSAVLTDFGISSGGSHLAEVTMMRIERTSLSALTGDSTTLGLSVPWAPPEALDDEPVIDARSDVYSLAATLFSLFEGRSPFEHPGGSNGALHMSRRIERGALVPGERVDAVPALSSLLRRSMSSDPSDRPQTALEFATCLAELERANDFSATPIEQLGDRPTGPDDVVDPDETMVRIRPLVSEETQPRPSATKRLPGEPADPTEVAGRPSRTRRKMHDEEPSATVETTRVRPRLTSRSTVSKTTIGKSTPEPGLDARTRPRAARFAPWFAGVAAVLAIAIVVALATPSGFGSLFSIEAPNSPDPIPSPTTSQPMAFPFCPFAYRQAVSELNGPPATERDSFWEVTEPWQSSLDGVFEVRCAMQDSVSQEFILVGGVDHIRYLAEETMPQFECTGDREAPTCWRTVGDTRLDVTFSTEFPGRSELGASGTVFRVRLTGWQLCTADDLTGCEYSAAPWEN
jgi:serine/threonine protein kinase